jgi:hypothetical protein
VDSAALAGRATRSRAPPSLSGGRGSVLRPAGWPCRPKRAWTGLFPTLGVMLLLRGTTDALQHLPVVSAAERWCVPSTEPPGRGTHRCPEKPAQGAISGVSARCRYPRPPRPADAPSSSEGGGAAGSGRATRVGAATSTGRAAGRAATRPCCAAAPCPAPASWRPGSGSPESRYTRHIGCSRWLAHVAGGVAATQHRCVPQHTRRAHMPVAGVLRKHATAAGPRCGRNPATSPLSGRIRMRVTLRAVRPSGGALQAPCGRMRPVSANPRAGPLRR